jgi:hypothetical protein
MTKYVSPATAGNDADSFWPFGALSTQSSSVCASLQAVRTEMTPSKLQL